MEIEFKGKTVMITGAAGHVGTALSEAYGQSCAEELILTDIPDKKTKLEEMADHLSRTFKNIKIR